MLRPGGPAFEWAAGRWGLAGPSTKCLPAIEEEAGGRMLMGAKRVERTWGRPGKRNGQSLWEGASGRQMQRIVSCCYATLNDSWGAISHYKHVI